MSIERRVELSLEALVIGRRAEQVLSPVVVEQLRLAAQASGQTLEALLDDLLIDGLRAMGQW